LFFNILHVSNFYLCAKNTDKSAIQNKTKLSKDEIKNVFQYWNNIHIINSKITQVFNKEDPVNAVLFMVKGQRAALKVDYGPGAKKRIYIKKGELLIHDLEDGFVDVYPVGMTPAGLVLKKNLSPDRDVQLVDGYKIDNHATLVLAAKNQDNPATLKLFFLLNPKMTLLGWETNDIQGNVTNVTIDVSSIKINDNKFVNESTFE
jgi:hypothetical protein